MMTTYSMTGFGQGSATVGTVEISVEIKSVNQRFIDISSKLPTAYCRFDSLIPPLVKGSLKRGRVEVYVNRREAGDANYQVVFNRPLFQAYTGFMREALEEAGVELSSTFGPAVLGILNKREVLELVNKESDAESEKDALLSAVGMALAEVLKMRAVEGAQLEAEIRSLLTSLEEIICKVKELAADTPELFKSRITEKMKRLATDIEFDENRLAQELAILADKADVTEELTRLDSHLAQFRQIIEQGEGGRKMEFLLQEIGREVNTTGSKTQNVEVTSLIVEAKSILEKMREQVQNIE